MKRRTSLLAVSAFPQAFLFPAIVFAMSVTAVPTGNDIREGIFLLAPQAYVDFCRDNPDDCGTAGGGVIALTPQNWTRIRETNASVNGSIEAVAPSGADTWALGQTAGHCATFAVQKRHELIRAGFPQSALSLAVVYTEQGVRHLVLAVRTDHGVFVLDNLRAAILPWLATGYRFDRIQSGRNPNFWASVAGSSALPLSHLMLARR